MHYRELLHYAWWIPFLVVSKQEELCGSLNSRTIYLQLGEHGDIVLRNQTWSNRNILRCSTELVTCPSCSIQISIENLNLPQICDDTFPLNNKTSSEHCRCGGLAIWEPTSNSAPVHLCSSIAETLFTSSTRSVGMSLDIVPVNWTGTFTIHFTAQKNQNLINGKIGQHGYINSPNFPSMYPRDFGIEHILSCSSDDCTVTLLFTDFLIATTSIMEFYDSDGKPLQLVSGLLARPKLIMSTGPTLVIRFFGNGGTGLGYKANYQFIHNSTDIGNFSTECGGEIDNLGGTIYMTGLSGYYDCIWIVQPSLAISHFKTHVYLKLMQYAGGELTLRQGQTSEDRLLEAFGEHHVKSFEYIAPITKGFYISYRGSLLPENKLVVAYSAFAYMDCLSGNDILCMNKRCVSNTLMCDSFDNCGDNSDEINCKPDTLPERVAQYWWPYRNSGINSENGPGGALLALGAALTGSALLLAVTLCRVALRMRSPPASHAPHHMDHIRTIAHLLSIGELDDRDEPPIYEPPPEYSQVVKPARPRRKHSTQRLIDRDTPTQQLEAETSKKNEIQILEKQQLVDLPVTQSYNALDNDIVRLTDTTSQPVSLETTGYEEDLGLSLTLSTTSQKALNQNSNSQWLPPPSTKQGDHEEQGAANTSVLSFDTLYSSEQDLPHPRHLIKSHSQDNMLRLRSESSTNRMKESSLSSYQFDAYTFKNQIIKLDKNLQPMNRNSLDNIDAVGTSFTNNFPPRSDDINSL